MKADDIFDDLARQKLQDLRPAPQEDDFLAMDALLDARQKRKPRLGAYWFFGLLGLLISTAAFWGTSGPNNGATPSAGTSVNETTKTRSASIEPPSTTGRSSSAQNAHNDTQHSEKVGAHGMASLVAAPSANSTNATAKYSATQQPVQEHVQAASSVHPHTAANAPLRTALAHGQPTSARATTDASAPSAADQPVYPPGSINSEQELSITPLALRLGKLSPADPANELRSPRPDEWYRPRVASPWELLVGIGAQSGTSVYSGNNSLQNDLHTNRVRSVTGGAELMYRMHGWSLGIGAHWTEHAETASIDPLRVEQAELLRRWRMTAVDTSVLVVTDTLFINGQIQFAAQHVDTTLLVLVRHTDTVQTTLLDRQARQVTNRSSYIEVPLLAEVGRSLGRFDLGVRGGPTLGFLTGSRGVLPTLEGDGYRTMEQEAFRSLTLGYLLRGHVRYRLNDTWAVGLEPFARGQLANGLNDQSTIRRSAAQGLLFTLQYRLPRKARSASAP